LFEVAPVNLEDSEAAVISIQGHKVTNSNNKKWTLIWVIISLLHLGRRAEAAVANNRQSHLVEMPIIRLADRQTGCSGLFLKGSKALISREN
jgi:hypothetical protein